MSVLLRFFQFFVLFILVSLHGTAVADPQPASTKAEKTGTIIGRILVKGGAPLSWGEVMLYDTSTGPPPMPEKYDRTPDLSRSLDLDGKFKITVPTGKYYIGAIKRMSGDRFGPPQEGDYALKIAEEKGKPRVFAVNAGAVLDIGTLPDAAPVQKQDLVKRAVSTAIEGIVLDTAGQPIENALVLAFVEPSLKGKPLFISDSTGKDGKYILRVVEGTYFLRVRSSASSGPPEPGQIVGYYGDGAPAPIAVKEGEIKKGYDFTVVLFGGRGPRSGEVQ